MEYAAGTVVVFPSPVKPNTVDDIRNYLAKLSKDDIDKIEVSVHLSNKYDADKQYVPSEIGNFKENDGSTCIGKMSTTRLKYGFVLRFIERYSYLCLVEFAAKTLDEFMEEIDLNNIKGTISFHFVNRFDKSDVNVFRLVK